MPLSWTIDHTAKLIVVTAHDVIRRPDFAAYLQAMPGEGAVGYRSILDMSAATVELHAGDLRDFSTLMQGRTREDCDGAIAIVVTSEAEQALADAFADKAIRARLARLFASVEDAQAWFVALDAAAPQRG